MGGGTWKQCWIPKVKISLFLLSKLDQRWLFPVWNSLKPFQSVYLSSSLANEPVAKRGEEGVGKQRMSEGVTAVLRMGGCCSGCWFSVWLLCWEMERTGLEEGRLLLAWSHATNLDQLIYRLNGLLTPLPFLYSWARVCVWGTISPGNPGPAPAFVAGEPSALRPSLSISAPSLQSSVCWLAGRNELERQRYPWSRTLFIAPINFGITMLTHDARAAMSCIYYNFGLLITSCWHHYITEPPVVTALILEPAYFRSHFERDLL